jgi:hypothetical protein
MKLLNETQVKAIKKAAGYRGRNVKHKDFVPGLNLNSYWDSGSRDYFYFVNVVTGATREVPQNGTPFDRMNLRADTLDANTVIAERVVMRGKDIALYIYS